MTEQEIIDHIERQGSCREITCTGFDNLNEGTVCPYATDANLKKCREARAGIRNPPAGTWVEKSNLEAECSRLERLLVETRHKRDCMLGFERAFKRGKQEQE